MKAIYNSKLPKRDVVFPCLAIFNCDLTYSGDGMIVLFIASNKGTCLAQGKSESYTLGQYSESFLDINHQYWQILQPGEQVILEN